MLAVADESDLHGITKSNARGVAVDLDAAGLTWFREEFDVRERRAHHQEGVALFDGLLRRLRAEQSDATCGVWAIIRHRCLAEKWLDDRRCQQLSCLQELIGRVQGALTGQ